MKRIFKDYQEYAEYFLRLIEIERKEEMKTQMMEIRALSGKKRERLGRAILNLRGRNAGRGLGGTYLIKFYRKSMPETEITVGDVVLLSQKTVSPRNPQGTVYEKGKNYILVSFSTRPPPFLYGRGIRMDLYVSDVTFQRMKEAVNILKDRIDLHPLLLGKKMPKIQKIPEMRVESNLNSSQREAVIRTLGAEEIFLIHGPPGTGKTTTLVESIVQHVKREMRVLATADSNVAVDNLVEKLAGRVKVVRVGNPARVTKTLREHTLDYLVQSLPEYKAAQKLWDKIDSLLGERDKYTRPTQQWRRGLGDDEIAYLARAGKSLRGIPVTMMRSMARWLEMQREIDDLFQKAKNYEKRAMERILKDADVICTTNSTAGSDILASLTFPVVFIDEATQSTEVSSLIPIVRTRKIIMAGDHKQLPPTVMSHKAKSLQYTLFERMLDVYGPKIRHVLTTQYRMNQEIMNFPNIEFYGGILKADESVKNITLHDLKLKFEEINAEMYKLLRPDKPVIFIDTQSKFREEQRRGSTSYMNRGEANLIAKIAKELLRIGLNISNLGIITPYDDQVDLLRSMLPQVEVKSVDGFQGREKEVIIISFVRSNSQGDTGFLSDARRLNVSLTRAKRKLVMVGDSSTLKNERHFQDLLNFLQERRNVLILGRDVDINVQP